LIEKLEQSFYTNQIGPAPVDSVSLTWTGTAWRWYVNPGAQLSGRTWSVAFQSGSQLLNDGSIFGPVTYFITSGTGSTIKTNTLNPSSVGNHSQGDGHAHAVQLMFDDDQALSYSDGCPSGTGTICN
jgi:hypothetical protein